MTVESKLNPEAVTLMRRLLRKIARTTHPDIHFDMSAWAYHTRGTPSLYGEPLLDPSHLGIRGTATGIAGLLVLAEDNRVRPFSIPGSSQLRAEQILGAHHHRVHLSKLWFISDWTRKNQLKYERSRSDRGRAAAALAQFEHVMSMEC